MPLSLLSLAFFCRQGILFTRASLSIPILGAPRMKAKITVDLVKAQEPGASDRTIFDKDVIGFGLRVRKTGAMSYVVEYKAGHGRGAPTRRYTLGKVGQMTPDQARKRAK